MALSKKTWAVAVSAAVCLAFAIALPAAEAQQPNSACGISVLSIVTDCFFNFAQTPTTQCCDEIKAATATQLSCLCDIYVKDNAYGNVTQPLVLDVFNQCGVPNKFSCGSGTGAANKISSMGVIGLFASLFLMIFYGF